MGENEETGYSDRGRGNKVFLCTNECVKLCSRRIYSYLTVSSELVHMAKSCSQKRRFNVWARPPDNEEGKHNLSQEIACAVFVLYWR